MLKSADLSDYGKGIFLISIMTFSTSASLVQVFDACFSRFPSKYELKTSKHEFADISQAFEGKRLSEGQARRNSLRFNNMQTQTDRRSACKIQTVFLPRFSCLFFLLSSTILHNNLLDLYLVEIRRYKLSFLAKEVTNTSHVAAPFLTF